MNLQVKRPALYALAILLVTTIIYLPSLNFDFAWLDHTEILGGQLLVNDWTEWVRMFTWDDDNHSLYHRPVYNLIHTLDYNLFGENPSGYHATNIFFHLVNTLLIFTLLGSLSVSAVERILITSLWALAPIHAPVVGLIHAKGDLVSTTFLLLGAWLSMRKSTGAQVLGSASILLALFTKEVALAGLPFLALYHHQKSSTWKHTAHLIYLVPLAIYLTFRVTSYSFSGGEGIDFDIHRLLTFPLVYASYFWESMPGFRLGISDSVWAWNGREVLPLVLYSLGFLASVGLQILCWRKIPATRPFILIFNLFLLPVSQLLPTLHFRADRFLYLASLGWIGILTTSISSIKKYGSYAGGLILLIMGYYGVRTYLELPLYENNKSLFTHTVETFPENREARGYMGLMASQEGDNSRAIFHYSRALNGNPKLYSYVDRYAVRANLATSQMRLSQYDAALKNFLYVSKETGQPAELDFNIGLCYKMTGQPQKAYDHMIRYQRKYPEDIAVMEKLVEIYVDMGKRGKAIEEINRILAINPRHPHVASLKAALEDLQNAR